MRHVSSLLLAPVLWACGAPSTTEIAPETNAVRCTCACGLAVVAMQRMVTVCLDQRASPSGVEGTFTEADLVDLCEAACTGGVQATAQESLVAEGVVDDACAVTCAQRDLPVALTHDACVADPDTGERIACPPRRCRLDDLPGDEEVVEERLLHCTQVVDDSREDPTRCGPDRPTAPICLVEDDAKAQLAMPMVLSAPPTCGASGGVLPWLLCAAFARRRRRTFDRVDRV